MLVTDELKEGLIDLQLSAEEPRDVELTEGGKTRVTPARWAPELADRDRVTLDGCWDVLRWPFALNESMLLSASGGDASWDEITQPGKVFFYDPEVSPDSIPNWNRVSQEHLNPEDGAILRRMANIPESWSGKRILLRFEGIYPGAKIYWDGKLVGEQFSGLTPIEFDVTDLATPGGRHRLAVRLYRRHPSIRLDMPRHALDFAGISRSAFLHAVENVHISDIRLQPELADDFATGMLQGEVAVKNTGAQPAAATLIIEVVDANGALVAQQVHETEIDAGAETVISLDMPTGRVKTWNAERPNLYTTRLRLLCVGQAEQTVRQRIGFRRFSLANARPTLNGNPVKFRGVNFLTFDPDTGMTAPHEWVRQCLTMMKRANVNAIRTHFFGPRILTDLCDEMGIYLLQELPIDWGHTYFHESEHLGPALHRMEAGVRRDRNHPCVMVWSIGNENMALNEEVYEQFMQNLRLAGEMVRRIDTTRPRMFPPPGPANKIAGIFEARIGEIGDTHYSFNHLKGFQQSGKVENPRTWVPTFETHTREELLAGGWAGVWFSSEYGINNMLPDLLNAPYTSVISDVMEDPLSGKNSQQVFMDRLNREWGYMRDDPTCLGGAYFPWIASGAGDQWGWVRWGEDADWGILTGDLTPKPVFWGMRVIFSPVRFPARITWRQGETEFHIPVANDYNSIDLAECTLRTQMGVGPPWMGNLRDFRDVPMAGAPGTAVTVKVPIWNPGTLETLQKGQPVICRCTVLDPGGYRPIMADVMVMPQKAGEIADAAMPVGPDAVLK